MTSFRKPTTDWKKAVEERKANLSPLTKLWIAIQSFFQALFGKLRSIGA